MQLSTMGLVMSKDKFDDLQKILKEYQYLSQRQDLNIEERKFVESIVRTPHLIREQLIILNSGIFHEGQLRGKQLTGTSRTYARYHINDIEGFVADVADRMFFLEEGGDPQHFGYSYLEDLAVQFDSGDYDKVITDIRKRFGISKARKLNDIKKKFQALSSEILDNLDLYEQKTIPKNIDSLFYLFKEYIPDAPDQTIADRISELLAKFDINVKANTMLQRIYRAKK
jgi:hypothetical protein